MSPPRVLGDFRIEEEIGRGGMGVVYLAEQVSLGRHVALKILPHEFTCDPMRLSRFHREAEVISRLDHPSIVPVYAVGEESGVHFIAMKYLNGTTVDATIKQRYRQLVPVEDDPRASTLASDVPSDSATVILGEKPPPPGPRPRRRTERRARQRRAQVIPGTSQVSDPGWVFSCIRIAEKVARALHHAHARGVVHRDVKPSNMLIQDGNPWLLDFGLVRDMTGDSLTETDGVLGTAFYMAPEQIRRDHEHTDHRVDIYSLGVTLYEMVTLHRPFDYKSPDALFHAIVNEEPVPPRRFVPGLPRDLETVILKAMQKEPQSRYQTAEEFADDLRRVRSFEPIVARPTSLLSRGHKWVRRNPALAGAFMFAFLSFVGMIEYSIYRDMLDRRRAAEAVATADRHYDAGDYPEAYQSYQLYIALGGDQDVVSPRLNDIMRRFREIRRSDDAPLARK